MSTWLEIEDDNLSHFSSVPQIQKYGRHFYITVLLKCQGIPWLMFGKIDGDRSIAGNDQNPSAIVGEGWQKGKKENFPSQFFPCPSSNDPQERGGSDKST